MIGLKPWPGERIEDGFGTLHFDEGAYTDRTPWQLSTDWSESGAINLRAGDTFWGRGKPPRLLKPYDVVGNGYWVFTAMTVTEEILDMVIEVSFAFGFLEEGIAEPPEPAWGPAQAIQFTPTGRAVAVLPREQLAYDRLMETSDDFYPAFKVEVLSGEGAVTEMVLQLEPAGGLQEIVSTADSEWVRPEPTDAKVLVGYQNNQVAVASESATTFSGVFGNDAADAAVQAAAAITRTGGNKSDAGENHLASPYFSGLQYAGGFVRVTNAGGTGPHPVDTRIIAKYLASADLSGLTDLLEVPHELDGSEDSGIEGRDWVRWDPDLNEQGVLWDDTMSTEFVGWQDSQWVWSRASSYSTSYVSVVPGTLNDVFGSGSPQPTGHFSGGWPPGNLDTVIDLLPPGAPFPNTPLTIHGDDLPHPVSGHQFTLILWDSTLTGDRMPVLSPGSWTVEVHRDDAAEQIGDYVPYRYQLPDFKYQVPTFGPSPLRVTSFDLDREYTGNIPLTLPTTSSSEAAEYMFGEVVLFTEPPIQPRLWFIHKTSGFAGNTFTVYGFGLGATQAELASQVWVSPGFVGTIAFGRFNPTVTTWRNNPDLVHAYDGTGVIFPGSAIANPNVDVECQVIEFTIPASLDITGATPHNVYVITKNGKSNGLDLMIYKKADLTMAVDEPLLGTNTVGLGTYSPKEWPADGTVPPDGYFIGLPGPDGVIPNSPGFNYNVLVQRYSRVVTSYVLTGRVPERPPTYLTEAKPAFALTGGAATTTRDDPVTVALGLPLRYRPVDSQVVPRPDLGTGMSAWYSTPSSGYQWKFNYLSAPYVDAENVIPQNKFEPELVRPAMAFPGNAWAELTGSVATGPKFTIAMAVTVFPRSTRSFLLSSFIAGVPDPDTYPIQVYVEGDIISVVVGSKIFTQRIAAGYIGHRPIIVAMTVNGTLMTWAVASATQYMRQSVSAKLTTGGLRFYLGRNNNAGSMQMAIMDVLDIGLDVSSAGATAKLQADQLSKLIHRLDAIYGVLK